MMPEFNPPPPGRYIDPLVDFAFKKIFGSEPNKDLLIAFLNEVFRGRKHIVDLTYNKNEHHGDIKEEGSAIFDLLCTGNDNEQFIIEIQRGRQINFKERALYYTSRLISGQAPKGDRWAYQLPEIYLIALLEDFTLSGETGNYLHDICLCNRDTGKIFYDKLGYTYIELRNFVKKDTDLETDLDKWLYVLTHISRMDKIPLYLRKPVFEKLFKIAEYTRLTKEEKTMYDSSMKYKWDNQNVLDYAVNEGFERGVEEGIERGLERGIKRGIEQGIEQGIVKGVEKGKIEEAMAIAREMKKDGFSSNQISKLTRLPVEEIEKL